MLFRLFVCRSHGLFVSGKYKCPMLCLSFLTSRRIMGRSIFTDEQKDFLVTRVPGFRDAQQNSTISAFFAHLYIEWFAAWPVDDAADDTDDDESMFAGDELSPMERMKNVSSFSFAC